MSAVRYMAVRFLRRRDRPPPPAGAEVPQTQGELRSLGMTVVSSVGYGIHCIDLSGQLHLGTAGLLDTAATAVHEPDPGGRSEPDLVIRDLPDVTFLDAVGVAALHRAHGLVRGRAEVRIDHPGHPGPRSMLELATDHRWLAPAFRPGPVPAVTRIRA